MSDTPIILLGEDAGLIFDAVMHAMYLLEAHDTESLHGNLEIDGTPNPLAHALARALLILKEAGAEIPDDEVLDCPDETDEEHDCKGTITHNCVNAEYRP